MENKKMMMPRDFKAEVDWIMDAYEGGNLTFVDGFQKDAIQNAVGARERNTWKNWKCSIDYIHNELGSFLVIEDEGTVGLTGPNINGNELSKKIKDGEKINPNWRLARFSARNVSGGNVTGAGQYGVGKTVYSACSKNYKYYYDSLRADGTYVANVNDKGEVYELAFENEKAKKFIKENTNLNPKNTVGTRIIIENPKEEICESIRNKEIMKKIQETWWRCLMKMDNDSGIFINSEKVLPLKIENVEKRFELPKIEKYLDGYRVKNFGFYIMKKDSAVRKGVDYYRKGMKIGPVDNLDIPTAIKDRYWGYIEVDEEWEDGLADIENNVHSGVNPQKKRSAPYRNLKNYINEKIDGLLVDWGYKKDKDYEDKKTQEVLKELSTELNALFDDLGFEDLGKGGKKPDFAIRWKGVVFPNPGSEVVTTGDKIIINFRINNGYLTDRKFNYSLDVFSKTDNKMISHIANGNVKLQSGHNYDENIELAINQSTSRRYEENIIVLKVIAVDSGKEKRNTLSYYYDTEKENFIRREVLLTLKNIEFPNLESRRVNFGESIKNIVYRIENNRNFPLTFSLNISVHNLNDASNTKIAEVAKITGEVNAFDEIVIENVPNIEFSEDRYSEYLDRGILELRARLIALEDSDEYEKGDRVTHYYQKIYLNMDEKSGKEGSFEPQTIPSPNDYRRSWCTGGTRRIIINSEHPAYKIAQENEEEWRSYMKQEMLKQYVLLYLEEGKTGMFENDKKFSEMEPLEVNTVIMNKIEEVYKKSFE